MHEEEPPHKSVALEQVELETAWEAFALRDSDCAVDQIALGSELPRLRDSVCTVYYDDLSGNVLKGELVSQARQEEL